MGKFYLHKNGLLIQIGECPDGHEKYQALPGTDVGLGEPPKDLVARVPEVDNTNAVIYKRNQLLAESDWTQLPDVPEETRLLWVNYRQALRDITDQIGFPDNVIFPDLPNKV